MADSSRAKAAPRGRSSASRDGTRELAPEAIGVKSVVVHELMPNPHNPRMLFDKVPMDALRSSIKKVGILVPLTVYRDRKRERYVILDGQRRWMVAQELGLESVPVNQVAEPTLVQNIVTMFQIHKVREDWELMPTALKLAVLMRELKEKNESKLALLTGLDQAVVSRCKKLLSFPKAFQDLMLDPDPEKRVKADFFIELYAVVNDRMVSSMKWFERDAFTRQMLHKYQDTDSIRSVTEFRLVKQHLSNARRASKSKEVAKRLKEFAYDDQLRVDHLLIPEADISATARKTQATVIALKATILQLDVEEYFGEDEFWNSLEELADAIRKKLREVGRRVGG